ncbi:MAG: hypothetical protein U0841_21850 [Chloroflexia bacterium]
MDIEFAPGTVSHDESRGDFTISNMLSANYGQPLRIGDPAILSPDLFEGEAVIGQHVGQHTQMVEEHQRVEILMWPCLLAERGIAPQPPSTHMHTLPGEHVQCNASSARIIFRSL